MENMKALKKNHKSSVFSSKKPLSENHLGKTSEAGAQNTKKTMWKKMGGGSKKGKGKAQHVRQQCWRLWEWLRK